MFIRRCIALASLAALSTGALAADPTASLDRSFGEYILAGPVGNNNLNTNTFYWMQEKAGTWMGQAVQSWFLMWDPKSGSVKGTVTFDQKILFVHDDKRDLSATEEFQKAGVTYNYSNNAVGLETGDKNGTSFAANTLSLAWNASSPGDHIRVMTAVPEPGTYALMVAGLAAVGFMARRRRQAA
jgi:hypothetical protein